MTNFQLETRNQHSMDAADSSGGGSSITSDFETMSLSGLMNDLKREILTKEEVLKSRQVIIDNLELCLNEMKRHLDRLEKENHTLNKANTDLNKKLSAIEKEKQEVEEKKEEFDKLVSKFYVFLKICITKQFSTFRLKNHYYDLISVAVCVSGVHVDD